MQSYNKQDVANDAWLRRTPLSSKARPFVSAKVMGDDTSPRPRSESPEPEPLPMSPTSSDSGKEKFDLAALIARPPGLCLLNCEQQGSSGSEPECEQGSQDLSEEPNVDPEILHARDVAAAGGGLSGNMTVMMRYIPSKYTQGRLINEINSAGFDGTYDFFYLPLDTRNYGNRGFAFINFISSESAEQFYSKYHGQKLKHFEATSSIAVLPADVQGFEESAERFFTCGLRKKKNNGEPVFLKPLKVHATEGGRRKGSEQCGKGRTHAAQKERKKAFKAAKFAQDVPMQMEAPYMPAVMGGPLGLDPSMMPPFGLPPIMPPLGLPPSAMPSVGLPPSTMPPRFCGICGNVRVAGQNFCRYCGDLLCR
mmetsp:Transcript_113153/g.200643  ORF Transcript_113153/g.200643 Transcript_113153/m.200643 type:complete len:366 (+) Transcript_113153:178-1275(+)